MYSKAKGYYLPLIVFAQFAGTSLWFAGNAIISDIQQGASLANSSANVTSYVQFGFIAGTLVFALLTVADRFSAPRIFLLSSLLASLANLLLIWMAKDPVMLFALRFGTGFFLAGIYPVGMKLAADLFPKQLGNALGFLVGALVLGTAFPHLIKSELHSLPWQQVIIFTSALATAGGILIYAFLPSYKSLTKKPIDLWAAFSVFRAADFRSASFGYFGHMWELYTLWAFVPIILLQYSQKQDQLINIPLWSFFIIGAGALGCVLGGMFSKKSGSKKVAFYALLLSGVCCFLSPFSFALPTGLFLLFLLVWGVSVVADSPQFSTLVAQSAVAENKGTALTIVTSIGFTITIVSVQLLKISYNFLQQYNLLLLAPGPVLGLLALKKYRRSSGVI